MKKWIEFRFMQHELWVLNTAERLPFFALIIAATLWVWALPFIPFLALYTVLMIEWPILTFVPSIIFGMVFLFFVAPWFFSWYFISAGLMFGQTTMAIAKKQKIERRLTSIAQ